MSLISRTTAKSRLHILRSQPCARPQTSHTSKRFASTGPSKTNETMDKAGEYAKKAYEQGSVVAGKALEGAKKYAGPLGERAQGALGGYREPITYNLSVLKELLKKVYISEALAPPRSLEQITQAYRSLWQQGSSPQWWRDAINSGGWKKVGVYALEAYGIFHIGEIIGRRSIVGYNLK